jgi:hypothetical protein
MTNRRHNFIGAISLLITLTAQAQPIATIPSRIEIPKGKIVLSEGAEVLVTEISAGEWAARRLTLQKDGKPIWISPLLDYLVSPRNTWAKETKLIRFDLDGNGKPDWLYIAMSRKFGSYNRGPEGVMSFTQADSDKYMIPPWDVVFCEAPSGFIVLDDEKTAYAFNYDAEPDPFKHSNPYVQGKAHFKGVVKGLDTPRRLQTAPQIPEQLWQNFAKLIQKKSCDTPNPYTGQPEKREFLVNWDTPQIRFGTDNWRDNIEEGLAMYHRAQKVYEERKKNMPREDLLTQDGLSVFRFDAFFETFPYDEIDPDNKVPEYTAMLNNYAFHQMAPADAQKAIGAESRRDPVDEGVIAMLAHVIRRDPTRTAAYLNLADALWRNGEDKTAAEYYRKYTALLKQKSPTTRVPKRVLERI